MFGANTHLPFSVHDNVDHPLNLYAATKKCNELMAHSYAHLFGLPTTGLRFFTVYGPWGRPDMAMWLFADAIIAGRPIKLFNHGRMRRDFTYVDDVVESIVRLVDHTPQADPNWTGARPDPASSAAPWRVYNIGNHTAVELLEVVRLLEEAIGTKAKCEFLPMQPGEVPGNLCRCRGPGARCRLQAGNARLPTASAGSSTGSGPITAFGDRPTTHPWQRPAASQPSERPVTESV